jgi:hypothetical protein
LLRALAAKPASAGFAQRIQSRFAELEIDELSIPERHSARVAVEFISSYSMINQMTINGVNAVITYDSDFE